MKHVDVLKKQFRVSLNLPGSKSITLRDAVLASLAQGQSLLEFPAECDDFSRISEALVELGVTIRRVEPELVSILGTGGLFRPGPVLLNAGLSGTAARFLIALALLSATRPRSMACHRCGLGQTSTWSIPLPVSERWSVQ